MFKLFQTPFVRAEFVRADKWELQGIGRSPPATSPTNTMISSWSGVAIPRRTRPSTRQRVVERYDMAILFDPKPRILSSDLPAVEKFIKAANGMGIHAEVIDKEDSPASPSLTRSSSAETTSVNHHTYRFSRRAVAEGLVVVDDPESILKCTNKVYLAELLDQRHILTPRR